jgi:DnaJ-class molecular chaperone
MAPGDEAPAGTPGTGENICRTCGGKGVIKNAMCPECQGSGTVIEGIGGA